MRKNTYLETITAITFLIFVGVILFYSFYPFKVTTLESIGINASQYCRGDFVEVEMKFQKHMDIPAEITWYIVDGVVYELEAPGTARPKGDNHVIATKMVPYSILPGKYKMRVITKYNVHPLHPEIINTWDTPTFDVLGEEDCGETPQEDAQDEFLNRPAVNQYSNPTTGSNTTPEVPITPQAGQSAQPTESTQQVEVYVQEQRGEPQVENHKPETPVRDLIHDILKPVKGLL